MTYEEFIGKEPSLNELEKFIKINKKLFDEFNEECIKDDCIEEELDYSVIYNYLQFAKDYGGHYYIGGHIKTYPNDPITEKSVKEAIKMNNESQPCHTMEVASKYRSAKELNNLEKILDVYYQKCSEEYYAPPKNNISSFMGLCYSDDSVNVGGEGYQKIANETMIGKKI
jgi:hypothetical protein